MRIGSYISYIFIILVLCFALMILALKLAEKKNSISDANSVHVAQPEVRNNPGGTI